MHKWKHQGKEIDDDFSPPDWATGFVYGIIKLQYENGPSEGLIYIGKKQLTSTRKTKIGKRAVAAERAYRADGKAKTVKKVTKSSGWQNYWSSSKELQEVVKGQPELYERYILEWTFSKKNGTYTELKYLFKYEMLEKDTYNANINGSLYRHDTNIQLYKEFIERKKKPNT